MTENTPDCPGCQSDDVVEIIYGYPTSQTMDRADQNEIELGGCVFLGDGRDLDFKFNSCGLSFHDIENMTTEEINNALETDKDKRTNFERQEIRIDRLKCVWQVINV